MATSYKDMINNLIVDVSNKAKRVVDDVTREVGREADEYAFKMIVPIAKETMANAYKESVAKWYDAYSPKKYKRSENLYDVYHATDSGKEGFGWYMADDGLTKPSWSPKGGRYNIYDLVFEAGYHGGPVHGRMQPRTTSVSEMFDEEVGEWEGYFQEKIWEAGREYFESHFNYRAQERLRFLT